MPSWAFGNSGTRFKVFAQPGVARDPYEKLDDAAQVLKLHRRRQVGVVAHPVGPGRGLRRPAQPRRGPGAEARRASMPTCSRRTTTCSGSVTNPDPGVRRKAIDHLLHCVDVQDADRVSRRQAVVLRRDELSRPGQHSGAAGPSCRRAAGGVRPAGTATSGCCWSTSCSSRRSTRWTSRTGAPSYLHCMQPRGEGRRVRRHRPPRARHQHRVHRRVCCCARESWVPSTSTRGSTPTTT